MTLYQLTAILCLVAALEVPPKTIRYGAASFHSLTHRHNSRIRKPGDAERRVKEAYRSITAVGGDISSLLMQIRRAEY